MNAEQTTLKPGHLTVAALRRAGVEPPDDGELESWRSAADELLHNGAKGNTNAWRTAAFKLQNAYMFGMALVKASSASEQTPAQDSELWNLVDAYARAKVDVALNPTHETAKAYASLAESNLRDALAGLVGTTGISA